MADTVDGAEHAINRGKQGVDARNRLAQTAIVMNEFGAEIAGDLAQMRHLAVAPADIKETAAIQFGSSVGCLAGLLARTVADLPVRSLLALASHMPPVRSLIVTRFLRVRMDLIKLDFSSKV